MIDAYETTTYFLSRIDDHCFSQAKLVFSWAPGLPPAAKSGSATLKQVSSCAVNNHQRQLLRLRLAEIGKENRLLLATQRVRDCMAVWRRNFA